MKFILAKKIGMTQVFKEDGTVVPVTRVQAGPCVVTQVKTKEKDGVNSVQIGFGTQKWFRLNKAQQGHLKGLEKEGTAARTLREFNFKDENHELKRGDLFTLEIFEPGEKVKVTGTSKGKGFQGVVKRHGFSGSPASHGHKDQLRMPGSIGATGPARVFKGTRMAGHMGDQQVTVSNLEVVSIDPETNEMYIKGAVPGARNGLLAITTEEGVIEVKTAPVEEPKAEEVEVKEEAPVAETTTEEKTEEAPKEETVETPAEEKAEEPKAEAAEETVEEAKEEKTEEAAPAETNEETK